LLEPAPIAGGTVMIVAGAGIVINGLTAWLFSAGGTGGASTDLNIRATFLHMAADAAVSAGVVLSAALIGLTGWLWLDPLASLAIVAVITAGTWSVLRQSANLAMDGVPEAIAHGEVQAYLASLPGVLEVHDLHIWALSTTQTALTAHLVRRDPGHDQSLLAEAARHLDQHFHINHATLQTESPELAATCRLRPAELV
ncbi:MAG: cation diffusion facilitator family transporter, partial [Rhodospirillales bacterium]|nr:cation diffusion facilitator family transporter [Rhodospirillales bacterium]